MFVATSEEQINEPRQGRQPNRCGLLHFAPTELVQIFFQIGSTNITLLRS